MNQDLNHRHELPSARKLVVLVVIAALAAAAILLLLVMPAEYEIDPTGAGRLLGLVPTDAERAKALTFDPPLIPPAPASPGR